MLEVAIKSVEAVFDWKNYLYEEYGMILLFDRRIPDGAVVIRRAQAWKFLDATVKNGYNTLVHNGNIRRI